MLLPIRSKESPDLLIALVDFEQIKDEVFEETEKNFRMQERLIKSFIRDLSLYLQHIRVSEDITLVRITCGAILSSLLSSRHCLMNVE